VSVARGQSVEGFGGKEAYYPLLEAIAQLARGALKPLVVETLARIAPTWLIQFPSLVRPEQQVVLQREILGATRERMVRELCEALEVITATAPLVLSNPPQKSARSMRRTRSLPQKYAPAQTK
jgi:hypothetical protein